MKTSLINPKLLMPNPFNPNKVSAANMEKLETSIRELGFASAVVVRELSDGTLQILGGQHRVETAIKLGLKEVPILNMGPIGDSQAKKIGLVDNSRYGVDDTISLAQLYEEIGMSSEELASFLPHTEIDFETVSRSVEIDLDNLDLIVDEDDTDDSSERPSRPQKTHDLLRFRVSLGDAEKIRQMIERTIKHNGLDDGDDLTAAGAALALLLLENDEE